MNQADLVPAVEAYLESNGLTKALSAMQAETKAKNMTPSKKVRRARRVQPRARRAALLGCGEAKKSAPSFLPFFPVVQTPPFLSRGRQVARSPPP